MTLDADKLPSSLPRPPGELERLKKAWKAPTGWRLLSAVNNSQIGVFYIGVSLLFFVLAGVLGLMMRAQLPRPDSTLLCPPDLQPVIYHARHGDDVFICRTGG